jgi:sortase A
MDEKRPVEELSVEELERILYIRKRAQRRSRLQRLKNENRVVEVFDRPPPEPDLGAHARPAANPGGALRRYEMEPQNGSQSAEEMIEEEIGPALPIRWRWVANKLLLLAEIGAVAGLIILALRAWNASRELNQELAEVQGEQSAALALPTPAATPVIGAAILPTGHRRVDGRGVPGESGNIPEHLLPLINAYVPPPIPTPGPEQARRLQIPAIDIDKPIVQGDDWEQLKKGVGQHVSSALPGQDGNLVLSAHNDVFGEIFRDLDKLKPGDEIIVSTSRQDYTYIVREIEVVEPTDVWVMAPTDFASTTLISCYPYLINNKRIVVFADLASIGPFTGAPAS